MNKIDLSFLANYHLLPQLMQRIYGICNLIILNFLETYLISFRYMLWRNQSGICPPFFYVIIAEKDKLKSLKEFFGLKIKNAVGPMAPQQWIVETMSKICFFVSVFLFLFFSVIPRRPVFCITASKRGCFANSKWASFGSNKKIFDLCENLVSVRKVVASILFFVASCLSMSFLPSLK